MISEKRDEEKLVTIEMCLGHIEPLNPECRACKPHAENRNCQNYCSFPAIVKTSFAKEMYRRS